MFQSLIGNLQTTEVVAEEFDFLAFQSLIGNLQTAKGLRNPLSVKFAFQSLIGNLQTAYNPIPDAALSRFQSLIGNLQTCVMKTYAQLVGSVSIPHR